MSSSPAFDLQKWGRTDVGRLWLLFWFSLAASGENLSLYWVSTYHVCRCRLDGLGPNAYEAFQASRDLRAVVNKVLRAKDGSAKGELVKSVSVSAQLMTPIQPMLVRYMQMVICLMSLYICFLIFYIQGDHLSEKPGNVEELYRCQENVRNFTKSRRNVRELSGKKSCHGKLPRNFQNCVNRLLVALT